MQQFKTLFAKTNLGAIQQWTIAVQGTSIVTEFGQVGGKLQTLYDTIRVGKSTGKKNATTAQEQAEKEAHAKWAKQKKKGYVEDIQDAQDDKVDENFVQGGIEPMLAPNKSFPKDEELVKRIRFPCYVQPKLDGMRCIAMVDNGVCTLWSRSRKPIRTVPHIVKAIEAQIPSGTAILDGELYSHEYRNSFEDLISILRKDEPDDDGLYKVVQYHVYDCVEVLVEGSKITSDSPFKSRSHAVSTILTDGEEISIVPTIIASDLAELVKYYDYFVENEYEGAMARNGDARYEDGKRSQHLQKMKPFQEQEFKILGVNEGRGKDAGTVATFTCVTADGKEFRARMKATYRHRAHLLTHPEEWEGKLLTVSLKRLTEYGIPYLPIAKAIRDYE